MSHINVKSIEDLSKLSQLRSKNINWNISAIFFVAVKLNMKTVQNETFADKQEMALWPAVTLSLLSQMFQHYSAL